ncbi:hypothetical protein B1A99_21505 [Cohnella sp. CIP 111063]|jgi:hypothetical protein|nr:hypothetical protein B1A99_21505 [Cohnella sp. CIP 111063]PRX67002.1 hypothetical protein B0G52_11511 [Cohnella sp. SGD-V74]
MRNYTFGIVSEGPTDFQMLTSIIAKLVPGEHRFRLIQPDLSETPGLGAPPRDYVRSRCMQAEKFHKSILQLL